jgi:leucyl aminopeptidase
MKITTTTVPALTAGGDTVVVGVFEDEAIVHDLPDGGLQALLDRGEARTKFKHLALTHAGELRILLVGLGQRQRFDAERARVAAASAYVRALELDAKRLVWEVPHGLDDTTVGGLVEGTLLRSYRFDAYRPPATPAPAELSELTLSAHQELAAVAQTAAVIARAQNRVRDLVNRPANDLTPALLAAYATEVAGRHPAVSITVLPEDQLRSLGMGAFAAVAQGSEEPAQLIHLSYSGAGVGAESPLLALVGKGITFDTGGLWLKPPLKMHEMISDMAGGAAVIEAVGTLAELHVPVNVIGVVGAAENMISGHASRPGDIVTALDGTTIELLNSDAEGRLVLGDCITYALREGAGAVVDIATLTGGAVTALGSAHAALFANDEALAAALQQSATRSGEALWRMPLHEKYAQMVKGRVAQITNLTDRREAQACTAAEFLHHFAGDTPWAHLDIAGTAWDVRNAYIADKGATGFGLRLLVDVATSMALSS